MSYFLYHLRFNQLYKRKQYLKQLTEDRSNQIKKIERIKNELIEKNKELIQQKNDLITEKQLKKSCLLVELYKHKS